MSFSSKIKSLVKPIYNSIVLPGQVPSPDARDKYLDLIELSYLYNLFKLFSKVENIPGHIVELGVGAGRNAILLGNLLKTVNQHGNARYFGFDTFESYTPKDLEENKSLSASKWKGNSVEFVRKRIQRHNLENVCELVPGDIRETLPEFISTNGHSRYSKDTFYTRFVYIDTSAYTPSKIGLSTLYSTLSVGGVMSIDSRRQGGEWKAMLEFCSENGIQPVAGPNFNDTPAFIIKR